MTTKRLQMAAVVLLLGCSNSFNTYNTSLASYAPPPTVTPTTPPPVIKGKAVAEPTVLTETDTVPAGAAQVRVACNTVFPDIPRIPAIPLQELRKVSPNDVAAVERIKEQHILDLREHIHKLNKMIDDARTQHLESCLH